MFQRVIPNWKTLPLEANTPVYLYELTLLDEPPKDDDGCTTASAPLIATRVGVLFPVDLQEYAVSSSSSSSSSLSSFETTFSRTKSHQDNSALVVRLTFCGAIRQGLSCEQRDDLIHMNHRVLSMMDWKNYGLGYHKEPTEARSCCDDYDSASNNGWWYSYLFCPLHSQSPSRIISDHTTAAAAIDWNLLRCERRRQSAPFLDIISGRSDGSNVNLLDDVMIQNRMVLHRKLRYRILGVARNLTALSPFPCNNISAERLQSLHANYNLDLKTATFADYYEKRYGAYVYLYNALFWLFVRPSRSALTRRRCVSCIHHRHAYPVSE